MFSLTKSTSFISNLFASISLLMSLGNLLNSFSLLYNIIFSDFFFFSVGSLKSSQFLRFRPCVPRTVGVSSVRYSGANPCFFFIDQFECLEPNSLFYVHHV